jgi:hypothetical protein
MRKIASIGFAIAALTVAALPALADDQSIGFATGTIGGAARPVRWDVQQTQATWSPYGAVQRAAPSPYRDYAQYGDYAQSGYGGYGQRGCTYTGGPKASTSWTCQ